MPNFRGSQKHPSPAPTRLLGWRTPAIYPHFSAKSPFSLAWWTRRRWKSSHCFTAFTARKEKRDGDPLECIHPLVFPGWWSADRTGDCDVRPVEWPDRRHQRRLAGLLRPTKGDVAWRTAFVSGLLAAPLMYVFMADVPTLRIDAGFGAIAVAGRRQVRRTLPRGWLQLDLGLHPKFKANRSRLALSFCGIPPGRGVPAVLQVQRGLGRPLRWRLYAVDLFCSLFRKAMLACLPSRPSPDLAASCAAALPRIDPLFIATAGL